MEPEHRIPAPPGFGPGLSLGTEWFSKEENQNLFVIRALEEDKPIGFVGLDGFNWVAGDAWVGIGIGEPEYWGRGYGTEAMKLVLGYGFRELNLHRVSLCVFEYNQRGYKSYLKAGFVEEGREREWIKRDGRHWDMVYMGILRTEWEALCSEV
jgi:RimJ/RimL family protein N-acetyltransferase